MAETPKSVDTDWDRLAQNPNYVFVEADKAKTVLLELPSKMREVEKFQKKNLELVFKCVEEDGVSCDKEFTTMSRPLITELKKYVMPAEEAKKERIKLRILRKGAGTNTVYFVDAL